MITQIKLLKEFEARGLPIKLAVGRDFVRLINNDTGAIWNVWCKLNEKTIPEWVSEAIGFTTGAFGKTSISTFLINQQIDKEIYVYRLTDAKGNKYVTIVNDPSDNGSIGGYGNDGFYHQYDSYELYHAYEWAEQHGMKLESGTMKLNIGDEVFVNKS